MSRPMSAIRNAVLPLAPIPESSPANIQQPPPPTIKSASTSPSDAMTTNYNNHFIGGMPVSFWRTPDNAVAAFSTQLGRYPKRQLSDPLPIPIVRSDLNHDVQKKAQRLVKQFPELARGIKPIKEWYHLYKYFDAVDIWIEGAAFCFFVIHRIGIVNEQLDIEQRTMIEDFAKEWIDSHEELIINGPPMEDLIALFDDADRGNLTDMREGEKKYLNDRLKHHRHLLLGRVADFRLRTAAQPLLPVIERAPPAMMGPHPGIMYPPPPHGFPQGPPVIDPQRTPVLSPAQGVSHSHQTYNQFVENQRNLASRFNPVVPPSNIRNDNNNRAMETRPRGWSNDTARISRGGRINGWYNHNSNPNLNGRRWVPTTPRGSPPRQLGSAEPIYVLASQHSSPQKQAVNSSQRIFSDPVNARDSYPQIGQRAFSDSSAGRGIFHGEPATAAPVIRRASSTDGNTASDRLSKNAVSSQDLQPARSGNSTPRATMINDARVLEAMEKQDSRGFLASPKNPSHPYTGASAYSEPHRNTELQITAIGNGGQTHTYFYAGPPRRLTRAEQGARTVYVGGVPYELFRNHTLKKMLSECGDLDNISYLFESGHAFAAFIDESSVSRAILKFDGHQLGSSRLTINLPRSRMRGDSYSSQQSFTSTRTTIKAPRDIDQRSRRPSFRNPYNHHVRSISRHSVDSPHHVRNFSRYSTDAPVSSFLIEENLMSSVSEVIQHNPALNRMKSQMPLESIENHFDSNSRANMPGHEYCNSGESFTQVSKSNRKENSPMKSDKQPMTPSRKGSFSSQIGGPGSKHAGGKNKRPRVSRQNSSTSARPTPAATPTKSRSESKLSAPIHSSKSAADSKEAQKEETSTSMTTEEMSVPTQLEEDTGQQEMVIAEKPKPKRKAPKKKKNASKSESESAMASSNSNNTSFATESLSDTFEVTSPVGTESSVGFMTSKSTSTSFSTLPSRKPSVVSSVSTPPMSEVPDKESISMKTISPKTPESDEKSTTPKPSQLLSKSLEIEIKSRSTFGKSHSKDSVVSTTSTIPSSLLKAEAKSQLNLDVQIQIPKAKINFDDQNEFPALGPAKSPASAIADGKRPPVPSTQRSPVIGTTSERVVSGSTKNQAKPAVPIVAVPRSYMPRPQSVPRDTENEVDSKGLSNDGGKDGIGSKTWPFVKKVRAK